MTVTGYKAKDFRNLQNTEFIPDKGLNVIFGENGQGKTNIIESIWMFTGCHSFRTHKCNELVASGKKNAKVYLDFSAGGIENEACLTIDSKREFLLNGVEKESPRRFLGEFQSVVFSPISLSIVRDAPSERRKFIDIAISMIKPAYSAHLLKYSKVLANRNALLKQISQGIMTEDMLSIWDEELSRIGAKITLYRLNYLDRFSSVVSEIYKEISAGREQLRLEYIQSSKSFAADEYEMSENIYMALQKNVQTDIRRQLTSVGPHKDDLLMKINDLSARFYASQGQQRSCALSMKLSEAYLIKEATGEYPVILLDDVMSELDEKRQHFLLEYLKGRQVFLTCCDISHVTRLGNCKTFKIEGGKLID